MALTDLEVFQETAYRTFIEGLDQQIQLFNAATRGGITLRSAAHQGDYSEEAFYKRISGLVRRRNAYGSGAVAAKKLEHIVDRSVKVAAGTAPVDIDPGQFKWIQRNPDEAGVVIGQQMAQDTLADMLNTGLGAYVAAIGAVAALVHDYSATGSANLGVLNTGASKFGDRSQSILCWVMHSKSVFDIYGTALTNSERLFQFGNVQVVSDGFGRPLVITDSANLINTTPTPDEYYTCGLTAGGIMLEQNNDFTDALVESTGDENIGRQYQAEWSYQLGLKGFAWDKANGGASPNDAAIVLATNWDKYVTANKDLAGVLVITQ
jgi:hypothetical protein